MEIVIEDRVCPLVLDTLGRGSCIGMYNILKEETYSFSCRAAFGKGTVIIAVSSQYLK